MPRFRAISAEDAAGRAKELLDGVQATLGMIPNLMRTMANSPAVLEAYLDFKGALAMGSLPAGSSGVSTCAVVALTHRSGLVPQRDHTIPQEASMKRTIALAAIACIVLPAATSALGREKAQYVGGTVASIRLKATGTLSTNATDVVVFTPDKKREFPLRVPYEAITSLDYSTRAGRGFGVSIRLTAEAANSKKAQHYLTMIWNDGSGNKQVAVFKLGKDLIPVTLTALQAHLGEEATLHDQEVRRAGNGSGR